jgi:hypothetical protein
LELFPSPVMDVDADDPLTKDNLSAALITIALFPEIV